MFPFGRCRSKNRNCVPYWKSLSQSCRLKITASIRQLAAWPLWQSQRSITQFDSKVQRTVFGERSELHKHMSALWVKLWKDKGAEQSKSGMEFCGSKQQGRCWIQVGICLEETSQASIWIEYRAKYFHLPIFASSSVHHLFTKARTPAVEPCLHLPLTAVPSLPLFRHLAGIWSS